LGFKQNPEWTKWCDGKTGGYVGVDTGVRSFQDWFVDQLVTIPTAFSVTMSRSFCSTLTVASRPKPARQA
ncbi:MAG TPA: hypothetical protein VFN66_00880, partial [Burkholderiales bacterium]|nr:hypothetical protein [Burkholderiales bacterium]